MNKIVLLVFVFGCGAPQLPDVNDELFPIPRIPKAPNKPGSEGEEEAFNANATMGVAHNIPVKYILDESLLIAHENLLSKSGLASTKADYEAAGIESLNTAAVVEDHSDFGKNFSCEEKDVESYYSHVDGLPQNFNIALNKISSPSFRGGMLYEFLQLYRVNFLSNLRKAFDGQDVYQTYRRVEWIKAIFETTYESSYRYIEIKTVPYTDRPGEGFYRFKIFFRRADDSFAKEAEITLLVSDGAPNINITVYDRAIYDPEGLFYDQINLSYSYLEGGSPVTFTHRKSWDSTWEVIIEAAAGDNKIYNLEGVGKQTSRFQAVNDFEKWPEFYNPRTDAFEYFKIATDLMNQKSAQIIDYEPEEKISGSENIFGSNSYSRQLTQHVVDLVRDGGSNQACSTTFEEIREAYSRFPELEVPSTVQSMPASVCRSNVDLADEQVAAALLDSCEDFSLNSCLTIADSNETKSVFVGICRKLIEANLLDGPQYLELIEDNRYLDVEYGADAEFLKKLRNNLVDSTYLPLEESLKNSNRQSLKNRLLFGQMDEVWETRSADYFTEGEEL